MMTTILIAAIVWAVFLASNIIIGFVMYRLGLHGQLRLWQKKLNDNEEDLNRTSEELSRYIPGSEFDPRYQPQSRYRDWLNDEEDFEPDPVIPGIGGGEEDDE